MELNRDQIIKALECCTKVGECGLIDCKCDDCPYDIGEDDCKNLDEYALALIKKLTEESQRWQQAYDCSDSACRELSSKCDELTEENEMLTTSCAKQMQYCITLGHEREQLKHFVNYYDAELGDTRVALAEANNDNRRLTEENGRLTEENGRLLAALNTDISIVRMSRGSGKTAHLREVGRIRADAIRANAVREMQEMIESRCIEGGIYPAFVKSVVRRVAQELLGESHHE